MSIVIYLLNYKKFNFYIFMFYIYVLYICILYFNVLSIYFYVLNEVIEFVSCYTILFCHFISSSENLKYYNNYLNK